MPQNDGPDDNKIADALSKFVFDPLGFVYFAYPWDEGLLKGEDGPDKWQTSVLRDIGNEMKESTKTNGKAVRVAVRSGHGIGKTALISWIVHWFMSTRPHPQAVVTANTKTQLDTKTWRELAKWHGMSLHAHWFKHTATKFYCVFGPKTWFAGAIPWNKEKPEAFAGTHEKHVLMVFDEASDIADIIWETSEGAMTTPGALWVVFGNPTKNTGRFSKCFKQDKKRWNTREIDSRDAKMSNKDEIEEWKEAYGEDSDFFRVRVKGQEPLAGSMQLIGEMLAEDAATRNYQTHVYEHEAKILAMDCARFGDDQSCIIKRQGPVAHGLEKYRNLDTMSLASILTRQIDEYQPDATFVDVVGIGAGVVDRCRQLGYTIIEVNGSKNAGDNEKYENKRTESWILMARWLEKGGAIPNDKDLLNDLPAPEYGFKRGKFALERKEDVKKRLGRSPDTGDTLALTFAEPVLQPSLRAASFAKRQSRTEYDVMNYGL